MRDVFGHVSANTFAVVSMTHSILGQPVGQPESKHNLPLATLRKRHSRGLPPANKATGRLQFQHSENVLYHVPGDVPRTRRSCGLPHTNPEGHFARSTASSGNSTHEAPGEQMCTRLDKKQCPNSARTVPEQCPKQCPKQCPTHISMEKYNITSM